MAKRTKQQFHWLNIARKIMPDFKINLLTNAKNCCKKRRENTIPLLNAAANPF